MRRRNCQSSVSAMLRLCRVSVVNQVPCLGGLFCTSRCVNCWLAGHMADRPGPATTSRCDPQLRCHLAATQLFDPTNIKNNTRAAQNSRLIFSWHAQGVKGVFTKERKEQGKTRRKYESCSSGVQAGSGAEFQHVIRASSYGYSFSSSSGLASCRGTFHIYKSSI